MPNPSIPQVNLGSGISSAPYTTNMLQEIGSAFGNIQTEIGDATLQRQQVGDKLLAPYKQALASNPALTKDTRFVARVNSIAKAYGIPTTWMSDPQQAQQSITPAAESAQGQGGVPAPRPGQTKQPERPFAGQNGFEDANLDAQQVRQQRDQAQAQPATTAQPASGAESGGMPMSTMPAGRTQNGPGEMAANFNANVFLGKPARTLADLSVEEKQMIMGAAPGSDRLAVIQANGIDPSSVPASILNAKRQFSPAQISQNLRDVTNELNNVAQGKATPDDFIRVVQLRQSAGIIDDQQASQLLSDPGYLQHFSAMTSAKFDQMRQAGVLGKFKTQAEMDRAEAALQNAKSLTEFRNMQAKYIGEKITYLPTEMRLRAENAASSASKAASYAKDVNQRIDTAKFGSYKDKIDARRDGLKLLSQTALPQLQKSYSDLLGVYKTSMQNFQDPSDVMMPGPPGPDGKPTKIPLLQAISDAKTALDQAIDNRKVLTDPSWTNNVVDDAINQNNPSTGQHVKTKGNGQSNVQPPASMLQAMRSDPRLKDAKPINRGGQWGVVVGNQFLPWHG